ncbi:hypothetical protein AK830_g4195 [Neonectria ditissima]|uniref:Uncharacterized protein n=1 Tax=Neonectria ditissima TaxID=78410 RepID=A0A0P7BNY1_9HYPO|nr:hypothetical protein AK830_g4195 [Neonectria ditissima]
MSVFTEHSELNGLPPTSRPQAGYTREEALWRYRTDLEGEHRHLSRLRAATIPYRTPLGGSPIPDMDVADVLDACNKSVAVYIPPPRVGRCDAMYLLFHNYLYRRWFRPYQSEIELDRFLCKTIVLSNVPNEPLTSETTIGNFISLNGAICAHVKAKHGTYDQLVAAGHYTSHEDSTTIGQFPVLLVRTGVEEGLSAPITFEGIAGGSASARYVETTLEKAADFVMSLEAREAAVFGLQPDPEAAWESYLKGRKYWMGPYELDIADGPIAGPSSKFVDFISLQYPDQVAKGKEAYAKMAREIDRNGYTIRLLPPIMPHYVINLESPAEACISSGQRDWLVEAEAPTNKYVLALTSNADWKVMD